MAKSNSMFALVVAIITMIGVKSAEGVTVNGQSVASLEIVGSLGCAPVSAVDAYLSCNEGKDSLESALALGGLFTITSLDAGLEVDTQSCAVYAEVPIDGCQALQSETGLVKAKFTNVVIVPNIVATATANF